jgi:HK97 family phage prohead protease
MKKKMKDFDVKFTDFNEEEGVASGYLSIFGNVDHAGDMVIKGAFKESLSKKDTIPFLFQHDPSLQIGVMSCIEDEKGLYVTCKYYLNTELGKEKYELAKANQENGLTTGLSIGYRIKEYEWKEIDDETIFILKAVDLHEGSQVTFACNELASIEDVKSLEDITARDIEKGLREVDAISNSLAKKYANILLKAIREESADDVEEESAEKISKEDKDEVVEKNDESADVETEEKETEEEVVEEKEDTTALEIKEFFEAQKIKNLFNN